MATYEFTFGVKTRSGHGGRNVSQVAGSAITGTGASDWVIDASGHIVPSGTYDAYKTYSKAAGQTYNLTLASGATCDITLAGSRADVRSHASDTNSSYQLKTVLQIAYDQQGALVLGDSVYLRDGTVYNGDVASSELAHITTPTHGYAGAGTITNGGTGYVTGVYSVTGGSGSSAKLYIRATAGVVVQVAVVDPGTGYAASDVISVSAGSGSGFQYTVIDLAARITVRSETPDATNAADGAPRRGGGAKFASLQMSGPAQTAACLMPIDFKYLDFLCETTTRTNAFFFDYRSADGYGVSFYECYFAVPDGVTVSSTNRIAAVQNRLGTVKQCRFYRCRNAVKRSGSGIGCWDASINNYRRVDNTIIRTLIDDNVIKGCNGDAISVNGTKNDIFDNFGSDFEVLGTSHQDCIQHTGFGENGTTLADVIRMRRNVFNRGAGNLTKSEPQGYFVTDNDPPTALAGVELVNNVFVGSMPNMTVLQAATGPLVERNTILVAGDYPDGSTPYNGTCNIKQGTGGVLDRCYYNDIDVSLQPGIVSTNNAEPTYAEYPDHFVNPVYGPFATKAEVIAAWKAKAGGSALLGDGTYRGALFPDGTWNDGTVYQATPPTTITQEANLATVTVNQSVTITYQLDAAANQVVTVTPGVSGVTGTFSAATATIGVGSASAQITFTPTSVGTATLSAADDRSLTGPSNITVTVTAAESSAPTSYTQSADRSSVTLGGGVIITYTLNAVATSPVVITPAVSGVTGAFSQATVTIGAGAQSTTVSFFPATTGTASLAASDDASLTDPAAIQVEVSAVTKGQLITLGLA